MPTSQQPDEKLVPRKPCRSTPVSISDKVFNYFAHGFYQHKKYIQYSLFRHPVGLFICDDTSDTKTRLVHHLNKQRKNERDCTDTNIYQSSPGKARKCIFMRRERKRAVKKKSSISLNIERNASTQKNKHLLASVPKQMERKTKQQLNSGTN